MGQHIIRCQLGHVFVDLAVHGFDDVFDPQGVATQRIEDRSLASDTVCDVLLHNSLRFFDHVAVRRGDSLEPKFPERLK